MNTQQHKTIKTTPYQVVFGSVPSFEPVNVAEEDPILVDSPDILAEPGKLL